MMFLKKNIYICFFLSLMLFNKLFSLDPPSELIIKDFVEYIPKNTGFDDL